MVFVFFYYIYFDVVVVVDLWLYVKDGANNGELRYVIDGVIEALAVL